MKLECEVIAVETCGDSLRVKLQGKPPTAAEWRGVERQEILIPTTDAAQRTFHIGRKVTITVKPK